jgi:hypothetical protein
MPTAASDTNTGVHASDLEPSSGLRRAALAEHGRIERVRRRLEERERRLHAELDEVRSQIALLDERSALLSKVASPPAALGAAGERAPAPAPHTVLRGRELRERAARLLFERYGAGSDVHYRRWLDDVLAAGYEIVAKDPPAAFLTTASRSPLVVRGEQPGTYRIDLGRAHAVRRRLAEAEAELADLAAVIAREPNPSAELREHRTRLTATLRRLERETNEVDAVLEGSSAVAGGSQDQVPRAA